MVGIRVYLDISKRRKSKFDLLADQLIKKNYCRVFSIAGFKFVILGWQESLTTNKNITAYKSWLNDLLEIYKEQDINHELVGHIKLNLLTNECKCGSR